MTEREVYKPSKPPPTADQLLRVKSMLDHPAFDDKLDSIAKRMDSMLRTKGGTGILIGWMKKEIQKYDEKMANPVGCPNSGHTKSWPPNTVWACPDCGGFSKSI